MSNIAQYKCCTNFELIFLSKNTKLTSRSLFYANLCDQKSEVTIFFKHVQKFTLFSVKGYNFDRQGCVYKQPNILTLNISGRYDVL